MKLYIFLNKKFFVLPFVSTCLKKHTIKPDNPTNIVRMTSKSTDHKMTILRRLSPENNNEFLH